MFYYKYSIISGHRTREEEIIYLIPDKNKRNFVF